MLHFADLLTTHARTLLRFELAVAMLAVAVGCATALYGAQTQARAIALGINAKSAPVSLREDKTVREGKSEREGEALFAFGKMPFAVGVAGLSSRYGDMCNSPVFTKVRETYQH